MLATVLLCYDGTRESRRALRQGAEVAAACGASVHLLAVVRPDAGALIGEAMLGEPPLLEQKRHIEEILAEGVAQLTERGVSAEGHVAVGEPIDEIARLARALKADLVVLGHRTRSPFARWWHSSVGQTLLDLSPCSLMVCVTPPDESQKP